MPQENWSSELPTRTNALWPVQSQENARGLKLRVYGEEELYYLCSKNKWADQLCNITAQLIWVFVFAKAKVWFSHELAQMLYCHCKFLNNCLSSVLVEKQRHLKSLYSVKNVF